MEYKSAKDMRLKEPGEFRRGGRWRGHCKGEKTGRMMWMKKTFPVKRTEQYNKEKLVGLEVEVARAEIEANTAYDDITGGHQSSFALVEQAVRLFGKNPDHYANPSYDEIFTDEKKKNK